MLLTSIVAFFPDDAQFPIAMVICFVYTTVVLLTHPYLRQFDDRIHILAQFELFSTLLYGLIIRRFEDTSNGLDPTVDAALSAILIGALLVVLIVFAVQAIVYVRRKVRAIQRKQMMALEKEKGKSKEELRLRLSLPKSYADFGTAPTQLPMVIDSDEPQTSEPSLPQPEASPAESSAQPTIAPLSDTPPPPPSPTASSNSLQ